MATITGQSVTAPHSGVLKLKGRYYAWPGACGNYATSYSQVDQILVAATVPGRTYTIESKGNHQTCPIYGNGGQGVVIRVTNTDFDDSTTGPAWQWGSGDYFLELSYEEKHDCLNGACTNQTTYKTPGIYQSLEECEQACGPGCGGVCLSNSEWATIQGLAAQNKSKNCS